MQNDIDQFLNLETSRMGCFCNAKWEKYDAPMPMYVKQLEMWHDSNELFLDLKCEVSRSGSRNVAVLGF